MHSEIKNEAIRTNILKNAYGTKDKIEIPRFATFGLCRNCYLEFQFILRVFGPARNVVCMNCATTFTVLMPPKQYQNAEWPEQVWRAE